MRAIAIFWAITLIQALSQAMADIYLPSFPAMTQSLNASIQQIELTLTIFALGYGVSQLFYGPLSDAIGRRKPILFGLVLSVIGSAICWGASSISIFMLGRICQALGAGAALAIGGAVLRDLFSGSTLSKYTSYSGIVFVIFLALAPVLGGYLQTYIGWRANFAFITICAAVAFGLFLFVPETNRYQSLENLHIEAIKKNVKTLLSSPLFIGYTLCSLLAYGAILAWITTGPVLLQNRVGLTPIQYGWVYALTGFAFAFGAFANSIAVPHFGVNQMLRVGLWGMFIAGSIMLLFKLMGYLNASVIVGPAILLSVASSLIFPNASAGLFEPFPEIAGITSALFYASRLLGGALFSGIVVLLPHQTQAPMAIALMIGGICALVIFRLTIKLD